MVKRLQTQLVNKLRDLKPFSGLLEKFNHNTLKDNFLIRWVELKDCQLFYYTEDKKLMGCINFDLYTC
jgi:hypothetical protein